MDYLGRVGSKALFASAGIGVVIDEETKTLVELDDASWDFDQRSRRAPWLWCARDRLST